MRSWAELQALLGERGAAQEPGEPDDVGRSDIPLALTGTWKQFARLHGLSGDDPVRAAALQVGGRVNIVVGLETLLGLDASDDPEGFPRYIAAGSGNGTNSNPAGRLIRGVLNNPAGSGVTCVIEEIVLSAYMSVAPLIGGQGGSDVAMTFGAAGAPNPKWTSAPVGSPNGKPPQAAAGYDVTGVDVEYDGFQLIPWNTVIGNYNQSSLSGPWLLQAVSRTGWDAEVPPGARAEWTIMQQLYNTCRFFKGGDRVRSSVRWFEKPI